MEVKEKLEGYNLYKYILDYISESSKNGKSKWKTHVEACDLIKEICSDSNLSMDETRGLIKEALKLL